MFTKPHKKKLQGPQVRTTRGCKDTDTLCLPKLADSQASTELAEVKAETADVKENVMAELAKVKSLLATLLDRSK